MGRRSKALVVVTVLGVSAAGIGVYRVRASRACPKASSIYSYKNFPSARSSNEEIRSFVTGTQFYGEIEEWTKAENCSGSRAFVGRILATATKERQEVLLASLFGAVIDSQESRSNEQSSKDFLDLCSSEVAKMVFDESLVQEKATLIRLGQQEFGKALFDVLSESVDTDVKSAFRQEVAVDRLGKSK